MSLLTQMDSEKTASTNHDSYNLIVIGGGLGGLSSATLFAMEGLKVCLLDKNKQIGGNFQTFSRDKVIFDSGVHYAGNLLPGQTLHQLFSYLGIMDKLKLHKLDDMFLMELCLGTILKYINMHRGMTVILLAWLVTFLKKKMQLESIVELFKKFAINFLYII